jgi:hypothetical protein
MGVKEQMRFLPIIVVGILLFSGFAAVGISKEADDQKTIFIHSSCEKIDVDNIQVDNQEFVTIDAGSSYAMTYHAGAPMIPRQIHTFEFPFGTKITDVTCEITSVEHMKMTDKILPAPKPIVLGSSDKHVYEMDTSIYASEEMFPSNWYTISTGGGLNKENIHTTFVVVESYPVRYNPTNDLLTIASDMKISFTVEEPQTPILTSADEYDMVIIAPNEFSSALQPLIDHKNAHGVKTYLKTTEDIYAQYTGVDEPEQIKYFIKDALDTQGITYVMLVGGLKSIIYASPRDDANKGAKGWLVPVRYTNNQEMGGTYDPGFISDLYYADIYDSEGNFSSWDQDRNGVSDGIFARWSMFAGAKDVLDLYPDVYVGRLACRNNYEVGFMVDKIISYETETKDASWFNNIIGVGGDSHEDPGTNYYEGEEVCNFIFDTYMDDFNPIKLYASYRDSNPTYVPKDEYIIREVDNGAGFLLFDGHGSPGSWNTHWPDEFNWDDTPGGISCYDFFNFGNDGKYPIAIVGGCHNSQFNVSLIFTALNMPFSWAHGVPYAECFGWNMARVKNGGSIASFGNTGLGYGAVGNHGDLDGDGIDSPDTVEALGGYQEAMFFKAYHDGVDVLGETWGETLRLYMIPFPGMSDQTDCKTVTQWPLLGDPSLKIGGY